MTSRSLSTRSVAVPCNTFLRDSACRSLPILAEWLRFVVAHAEPGLVIHVEELVDHDRGHAAFGLLVQILVEGLNPELPARRQFLELALSCGTELLVGVCRFKADLESLHDPSIAFWIVQQQN